MNRVSVLLAINRFYRILGAATVAGAEANAEAPWSVINRFLDKSYSEVSGWNETIPKFLSRIYENAAIHSCTKRFRF